MPLVAPTDEGEMADPVVARVGDKPIHGSEVRGQMQRDGAPAAQALDTLIRFQLLAAALLPAPLLSAPGSVLLPEDLLVQSLLEKDLERHLQKSDMPDDVIRSLYDKTLDYFVHPRLVEIGIITVNTGNTMKPAARQRQEQVARELAAYMASRKDGGSWEELKAIAADPAWSGRRVSFARLLQGTNKPFSAAVGAEVAKLSKPGDTTPWIEDSYGHHRARYISEQPPKNVPFLQARDEIRDGYYPQWRKTRFAEFARDLVKRHRVEVYTDRLFAQPNTGS